MTVIIQTRPAPARSFTIALAFACLAAACGGTAPPAPVPGPDVWAVVDGREIHKEAVDRAYRRVAPAAPAPSEDAPH